MNSIFRHCGIDRYVLIHKARCVVMNEATWNTCFQSKQRQEPSGSKSAPMFAKSITDLVLDHYEYDYPSDMEEYEDDECSNCSMEGATSCSSDDSNHNSNRVSFCSPLVTATYVRPTTTAKEKLELFYTEIDYREFRRNYLVLNRIQACRLERRNERRSTIVQIHPQVVTATHTIPSHEDPTELYYTQSDLQGFLDDFVRSLVKG